MARNSLTPSRSGGLLGRGDPVLSLYGEMNRLFDDVFRGAGLPASAGQGPGAGRFIDANLNVSETAQEIRVTAELPGVTDKDIDVSLDDDILTIRGEKTFEERQGGEKESYHIVERSYGTFQRSLRLPFTVDPDQVKASFEHGVLTVTLPKTAQQERVRKIQVQGSSGEQNGSAGRGSDAASQSMTGAGRGTPPQGNRGRSGT
ncbi:type III effector protein [Methylobacterium variabile]|jgi:HSP20 family protein|uniref:Type III effector protein n=2 Tax=Methylobacterium variabile TaxID=298794 RepID=A0A0J6VM04_9HYPH|nr:type III effector protein [Methylobacterium variabile]